MPTHDFTTPISPGTLRISVVADGNRYVTDLPSAKLAGTLKAFAAVDAGAEECVAVTVDACDVDDAHLACVGALVLFLRMSDADQSENRERLRGIVGIGGCAILTVSTESEKGEWEFGLYEVPMRRPSAPSGRSTQRDRPWRWR